MLLILFRLFMLAGLLLGARVVAGLFIDPKVMADFDDSLRRTVEVALKIMLLSLGALAIVYIVSELRTVGF